MPATPKATPCGEIEEDNQGGTGRETEWAEEVVVLRVLKTPRREQHTAYAARQENACRPARACRTPRRVHVKRPQRNRTEPGGGCVAGNVAVKGAAAAYNPAGCTGVR